MWTDKAQLRHDSPFDKLHPMLFQHYILIKSGTHLYVCIVLQCTDPGCSVFHIKSILDKNKH